MIRTTTHTIHTFYNHSVHVHLGKIPFVSNQCVTTETTEIKNLFVTTCGKHVLAGQPRIAYCVPPLYNNAALDIQSHLDYYRTLGIDGIYLYHTDCNTTLFEKVTNICMPWIRNIKIHQRGQLWQVNDCNYRAAIDGFSWTLHMDIDERLRLPPNQSLAHYTSLHKKSDAISFGSMRNGKITCFRWKYDDRNHITRLCPEANGWRKYIMKLSTVRVAETHKIATCYDTACKTTVIDTNEAYIEHSRSGTLGVQFHKTIPRG